MPITFSYVGIETNASNLVGEICSNPTNLGGRTENWHFRITGLTIPPVSNPIYPRLLTDSTGNGKWFNPSATSQRTDNKCNPPANNWPMHVVPSLSGGTVTWDMYVAAFHDPASQNNQPLPGLDYTIDIWNNTGSVATYTTRIPGLRYIGVQNTPFRTSWSIKPQPRPDTVGTDCANPETNNVATNWQFVLAGIHSYEGAILLEDENGWPWNFSVNPSTGAYVCVAGNHWPMGVSPNFGTAEPGTSNVYTWTLYVAPHGDTLPQINSLFTVTIYDANTQQTRQVTAQIFA